MGFEEVKLINSNFISEPLDFQNYIYSIERSGKESYIFSEEYKKIWRSLLTKSTTLFADKSIHDVVLSEITDDDAYYMVKNCVSLGKFLNLFYNEKRFSSGDIIQIIEYFSTNDYNSLDTVFRKAISKYCDEIIRTTDKLGEWINKHFDIDVSEYNTIDELIDSEAAWTKMLTSDSLLTLLFISETAVNEIIKSKIIIHYNKSNGDYYDEEGNEYTSDNTFTGNTITKEVLKTMYDNGLVTKEEIENNDGVYKRLKDSLNYACRMDTSMDVIVKHPELLSILTNDEDAMNYIANDSTALKNVLQNEEFAKSVLTSNVAMNCISESTNSIEIICEFFNKIADSQKAIEEIIKSTETIKKDLPNIHNADYFNETLTKLKDNTNETLSKLNTLISSAKIIDKMAETIGTNTTFCTKVSNNDTIIDELMSNKEFTDSIVKNEEMINAVLKSNNALKSFLTNTTSCNSLVSDNRYMDDFVIDDIINLLLKYEGSKEILLEDSVFLRKLMNKLTDVNDQTYNDLDNCLTDDAWCSNVSSNEKACTLAIESDTFINKAFTSASMIESILKSSFFNLFDNSENVENGLENSPLAYAKYITYTAHQPSSIKYTDVNSFQYLLNGTFYTHSIYKDHYLAFTSGTSVDVGKENDYSSGVSYTIFSQDKATKLLAKSETLQDIFFNNGNIMGVTDFSITSDTFKGFNVIMKILTAKSNYVLQSQSFMGRLISTMSRKSIYYITSTQGTSYISFNIGNASVKSQEVITYGSLTDWNDEDWNIFKKYIAQILDNYVGSSGTHKIYLKFSTTEINQIIGWENLDFNSTSMNDPVCFHFLPLMLMRDSDVLMSKFIAHEIGLENWKDYESVDDMLNDDVLVEKICNSEFTLKAMLIIDKYCTKIFSNKKILNCLYNHAEVFESYCGSKEPFSNLIDLKSTISIGIKNSPLLKTWNAETDNSGTIIREYVANKWDTIYDGKALIVACGGESSSYNSYINYGTCINGGRKSGGKNLYDSPSFVSKIEMMTTNISYPYTYCKYIPLD